MQLFAAAAAVPAVSYWPFAILVISVALVVFLITVLRVHAFLALILAAITAGLLTPIGRLPGETVQRTVMTNQMVLFTNAGNALVIAPLTQTPPQYGLVSTNTQIILPGQKLVSHWVQAVELTTIEFGVTAGKIAVVIGLASVIGMCLMESGAADKIVRRFLAVFGERHTGLALFASSYVISIPIFFDTFFMLVLPIARALRLRTGKDYLLYVMAICCAGSVTHSMVAPHPGPLAMAETLRLDLGLTIIAGIVAGLVPALGSWWVAKWLNRRTEVPLRETAGASLTDMAAIIAKGEDELPPFSWSILPIILPIALISLASFLGAFGWKTSHPVVFQWVEFIGNRNVALLIGAGLAMGVLARQRGYTVARICELVGPPFETAGVIILITSAGGAFGLMLKNAGVGEAIKAASAGYAVNYILLSWLVASVIRIAQGSATVAMLTTAAMMLEIIGDGSGLPYHPIYIFLAIGFGAMIFSWMNDSGFWVVSKLSGFTEGETLKSWTVVVTVNAVVGLIVTLAGSWLFPMALK